MISENPLLPVEYALDKDTVVEPVNAPLMANDLELPFILSRVNEPIVTGTEPIVEL